MDDGNGGTASQTFNWIVNDTALAAQGVNMSATEGLNNVGVSVASFTDRNLTRQTTDYTATINWGDGSPVDTNSTITGSSGSFSVAGNHLYNHPGSYTITTSMADAVGGTLTSTSTASVTTASLTASGSFLLSVVRNTPGSFTLATFTDANPNDTASSYSATIAWGDGSANSAGTITGSNGLFSVSGTHTYPNVDGSYTATVTISDVDNTSASTTSTVSVGDIYTGLAGNPATLTVASFTDTDPNATFTATINWGDGHSGPGTVSGHTVTGSHIYQNDQTWNVQVTVTDNHMNTISASSLVKSVHEGAGLVGYAATQLATVVGTPSGTLQLGAFEDPTASGTTQTYTGTVDAGDGTTPTSATITGSGGFFYVSWNHTYTALGQYMIKVLVQRSGGVVLPLIALARAGQTFSVKGPAVVPGNSVYQYAVYFPWQVKAPDSLGAWGVYDDNNNRSKDATVLKTYPILTSGPYPIPYGAYMGIGADVQFLNKEPASLRVWVDGAVVNGSTLNAKPERVTLVRIEIKTPAAAFETNDPSQWPIGVGRITLDGKKVDEKLKAVWSGTVVPENGGFKVITPAFKWEAKVKLIGLGANQDEGVGSIEVGFIQHVTVPAWNSVFPNSRKTIAHDMQGSKEYLDSTVPGANPPWYAANPKIDEDGILKDNDAPGKTFVMKYSDGVITEMAKQNACKMVFTLDIAARTKIAGYDNLYWQEATLPWTVDLSGTFTQNGADYTWAKKAKNYILVAGQTVPSKAKWKVTTTPLPAEKTNEPVANIEGASRVYRTENLP